MKNTGKAYLLWLFLPMTGAHRFYCGKFGTGLLMFLTLGGFVLGWMADIARIPAMVDEANDEIKRSQKHKRGEDVESSRDSGFAAGLVVGGAMGGVLAEPAGKNSVINRVADALIVGRSDGGENCRYTSSLSNCATCDFWVGARNATYSFYEVEANESDAGMCGNRGGPWRSARRSGEGAGCPHWRKWNVLEG